MVGAERFQIIWAIGVRPNQITWMVGISLRGRGRKNIICKKERSFIKSSQKKALSLANRGNDHYCLHTIVKPRMFPTTIGKKRYQNKLPNSGFCSGHYFTWETCIFRRIYSRKQHYRVVSLPHSCFLSLCLSISMRPVILNSYFFLF